MKTDGTLYSFSRQSFLGLGLVGIVMLCGCGSSSEPTDELIDDNNAATSGSAPAVRRVTLDLESETPSETTDENGSETSPENLSQTSAVPVPLAQTPVNTPAITPPKPRETSVTPFEPNKLNPNKNESTIPAPPETKLPVPEVKTAPEKPTETIPVTKPEPVVTPPILTPPRANEPKPTPPIEKPTAEQPNSRANVVEVVDLEETKLPPTTQPMVKTPSTQTPSPRSAPPQTIPQTQNSAAQILPAPQVVIVTPPNPPVYQYFWSYTFPLPQNFSPQTPAPQSVATNYPAVNYPAMPQPNFVPPNFIAPGFPLPPQMSWNKMSGLTIRYSDGSIQRYRPPRR